MKTNEATKLDSLIREGHAVLDRIEATLKSLFASIEEKHAKQMKKAA